MVDVLDTATRSRMMAGIKGKNTKPEMLIRSLLHRQGFRFRLNVRELPGKPDIVLPRYRAVIFVNAVFVMVMTVPTLNGQKPGRTSGETKLKAIAPMTRKSPKPCLLRDGVSV